MANLPPLVRKCIAETATWSSKMLATCIEQAVMRLQEEEVRATSQGQRQELGNAWRGMARQKAVWMNQLPPQLLVAFEKAAAPPTETQAAKLRPSSLTLVDDDEVAQTIEASRLAQMLASKLEQPLAELDALMSSALGLPGISPEQNPLRPSVFAQTLRSVMAAGDDVQPGVMGLWLRYMAPSMTEQLDTLYKEMARRITQARVQAAGYRVLGTPGSSRPAELGRDSQPGALGPASGPGAIATAAAALAGRARGASAFAELAAQELAGAMFQEFLFRGGAQAQQPLAASFYEQVDQELADLQAMAEAARYDPQAARAHIHLPAVQRPARPVGVESPLDRMVWGAFSGSKERAILRTQLKKQAQNLGQVLGLEVVRKLVNQVAQDPRLLAPVREAIVALEPSLLRLAMVSPRFFSEEEHPGRRLVERVAERSFKYNDEFSQPFAEFFGGVIDTFNHLNGLEELEDATAFKDGLAALEAHWVDVDRAEESQREMMRRGVEKAEKRQAEAARIAGELSQRSDLEGVPPPVRDFLLGPWALVMAHMRQVDTRREIDPGGFGAVVSDLLWSIKRDALRDPARAFELIPRVVGKLRGGLTALGQPPEQHEAFFRLLETLHRPVMKLRLKHRKDTNESVIELPPAYEHPATDEPAAAEALDEHVWLAPKELEDLGFEDTIPSDLAPLLAEGHRELDNRPEPVQLDDGEIDAIIGSLVEGAWVDLFSKQTWHRAQLIWAAARGTLFMFTSHGGQPHSMTRRSMQRLVRDRLLRPVESDAVVPRAIDAISREEPAHA